MGICDPGLITVLTGVRFTRVNFKEIYELFAGANETVRYIAMSVLSGCPLCNEQEHKKILKKTDIKTSTHSVTYPVRKKSNLNKLTHPCFNTL